MSTWQLVILTVPPLLVAVILHEIAHGAMANYLGDPTAKQLGRISLNPIVHVDPVLTILLPALLVFAGSPVVFGGAKPVPVNPMYFENPRRGMVWVALAGPLVNFALALLAFGFLKILVLVDPDGGFLKLSIGALIVNWVVYSILINLVLGIFNLIPVPPLDGGRIAVGLLPTPWAIRLARLEPYGIFIVFGLLWLGFFDTVLSPIVRFVLEKLVG